MREIFATIAHWLSEGRPFSLATLVGLREAATAPIGTTIAVDASGRIVGNIGAGCHETEIVEACARTLADGQTRTLDINLTSQDPLMGGSACGAVMEVVVWRPKPDFAETARAIATAECDTPLTFEYESIEGHRTRFEHVWPAREILILVGATTLAAEIARFAKLLDLRVVVVDPRPPFATRERVPDADEIVLEWPDKYLPAALSPSTSVVVLSHDPKFDVPALECALASDAPYIGLLGSRRSQAARRADLRQAGISEEAMARIHGPVGLDIGGTTPAETALSIVAEIVAVRRKHGGAPLAAVTGAIHRREAS